MSSSDPAAEADHAAECAAAYADGYDDGFYRGELVGRTVALRRLLAAVDQVLSAITAPDQADDSPHGAEAAGIWQVGRVTAARTIRNAVSQAYERLNAEDPRHLDAISDAPAQGQEEDAR